MYSIFHTIPPLICVKVARCAPSILWGVLFSSSKRRITLTFAGKKRVNILPIL